MESSADHQLSSNRRLAQLKSIWVERKNPEGTFAKLSGSFRRALTAATVAYFLFLLVMLFLLGWWGERNLVLSVLLFVPGVLWIVPLIFLTPLHWIFRKTLCWFTLAASFLVAFVYLDLHRSPASRENSPGLTVITANMGERNVRVLNRFLDVESPDIVGLQDAWRLRQFLKARYPERAVMAMGEFLVASKYPILRSGLLTRLAYHGSPIGAWYELDYNGRTILLYNIHMPTPRPEFLKLRGRGLLEEAIHGGGIFSAETRRSYADYVSERIRLSRGLIEQLEAEKRPFLVIGDFNMPANGYLWDLFRSRFTDAFGTAGNGYGFTFPSTGETTLHFFGPWLRLDYLFAGREWNVNFCRTEPGRPGQHRAVVAQFHLPALAGSTPEKDLKP